MVIQIDKREQKNKNVLEYFDSIGQQYKHFSLPIGDYADIKDHSLVIDKKSSGSGLQEVAGNVCQDHARFTNECKLAQESGVELIFLVEEEIIGSLQEVHNWINPRLLQWIKVNNCQKKGKMMKYKISKQPPINGDTLQKIMETIEEKYGCKFIFCKKEDTGRRIIEILKLNKLFKDLEEVR